MKYIKSDKEENLGKIPGTVIAWADGIIFRCPCDQRQVYVASPPHTISFDSHGYLTLDGSVGSHEDQSRGQKPNWCHFWIKNGNTEMCSDTACPGGSL